MSYFREFLSSKIHRATVTLANVDYEGSITIDEDLMDEADIYEYQKVLVASITTGHRFETYVIKGKRGSGAIEINGAAANLVKAGEMVIIMAFELMNREDMFNSGDSSKKKFVLPKIIYVNEKNQAVGFKI